MVLLHADALPAGEVDAVASRLWPRLWDRRVPLDQAVRGLTEMTTLADADHRVAIGAHDARCVAGDAALVVTMRTTVLTHWRRDARERLAVVRDDRAARIRRSGMLAYEAVPDLKSSAGGLRDAVLLRAIATSWLVDVPSSEVAELAGALLDVRDVVHAVTGRRGDKWIADVVPEVAARLGTTPGDLDVRVRDVGRRLDHVIERCWRRLDDARRDPHRRIGARGPVIDQVARGVGVLDGEVVLTPDADPAADAELVFRVAAVAAQRGLVVNEASLARLARTVRWPEEALGGSARRWLIDLLASGEGLVPVWHQLDFAGLVDGFLPEWERLRLRGSSSPVHRFTIDRHSLQAVVNAAGHLRDVERPDLLLVACLLHDIGKQHSGDHSEVGAPIAAAIARRWGFDDRDAATIHRLVRHHLLLPTVATRRDIEDPATVEHVASIVEDESGLDLLAALTACDARATGEAAWSSWRRGLVEGLVSAVRTRLRGTTTPAPEVLGWPARRDLPRTGGLAADEVRVEAEPGHDGSVLTVVTADRAGLLADLAGALAVARLDIRSCRAVTRDGVSITLWEVTRPDVDAVIVADRIRVVLAGGVDLATRLAYTLGPDDADPAVSVVEAPGGDALLLQIRTRDRRGLMWTVCHTIAAHGLHVRSAHLTTYGDEARDVFYVTGPDATVPDDATGRALGEAVRTALA